MEMMNLYIVVEDSGIYEIMRLNEERGCQIVQTNIRTWEKAKQARDSWQQRELKKYE